MKIKELTQKLLDISEPWTSDSQTDSLKFGDAEREINKLAICCIATPEILKAAIEWGADLLITHEPTFYGDGEVIGDDAVSKKKYEIIKNSDMAIFRYHDRMHTHNPDIIGEGFLSSLGISGSYEVREENGINKFICDKKFTASELASLIENKLGLAHVRISGEKNKPSNQFALCLGAVHPVSAFSTLKSNDTDFLICGETWEWMVGEYARDAAQLGINKAVLLLGHMGSEKSGMKFLANKIAEKYTDFETKYFDCGEVY